MTEDFTKYQEVYKKLKILRAESWEQLVKKLDEFEKTHNVIDIKNGTDKMMFVFYVE